MANTIFQYDVFLSYNRKDRDWTRELAKRLQRRKFLEARFRVFVDEWSIKGGEPVPSSLGRALKRSRYVIPIMSPDWVTSDWCQFETETTIVSDPGARRRKIIPVLLKDCSVPEEVSRLNCIDFRDPNLFAANFEHLVNDLRLAGQIQDIEERQRQRVLNSPILPWSPERSPSLDFIWPELFIEPKLKPHKHPGPVVFLDKYLANCAWEFNVAIIGAPGAGKSTALRSVLLKLTDPKGSFRCQRIPLMTTAGEILEFIRYRQRSLVSYLIHKIGLVDSSLVTQSKEFLLLVDGLDEIDEAKSTIVLNHLNKDCSNGTVVWLGCRSDFFYRNVALKSPRSAFSHEVLELLEWDENADSLTFASKYSERLGKPSVYSKLLSLKREYPEITPFLRNPFELTLLLYLLSGEKPLEQRNFANSYALYQTFYDHWIAREHHRGTAKQPEDIIRKIHQLVASQLYASRGLSLRLSHILKGIDSKIPLNDLLSDSAFMGLLVIKEIPGTSDIEIIKFWHETIEEFLVADCIVETFQKGGDTLLKSLSVIYDYEVNVFVRGAFQCVTRSQREIILQRLNELYARLFSKKPLTYTDMDELNIDTRNWRSIRLESTPDSKEAMRVREQILYYIGRLPLPFIPNTLKFAYHNEDTPLLRRIAALGAILHGDEDIEMDYLEKLIPGSPEDQQNRSVQLVYFGDVDGDIHFYCDDEKCAWERTKNAILQRLQMNSVRELRLRLWDLRTLYLFYSSRNWRDPISREQYETILNMTIASSEFSENKSRVIHEEKGKLTSRLMGLLA